MHRYSPGTWYLVAAPTCVVIVPAGSSSAALESLRVVATDRSSDLGVVLDALVRAFGGGLATLPDFAIACLTPDGGTGAVRGLPEMSWPGERRSGLGATSWIETTWSGEAPVEISLGGTDERFLPLVEGVVLAGRVTVRGRASDLEPSPEALATPTETRAVVPETVAVPTTTPTVSAETPALAAETLAASAETLAASAETVAVARAGDDTLGAAPGDDVSDEVDEYDRILFGETHLASVEEAAVRAPVDAETNDAPGLVSTTVDGDHDGHTLSIEQLRALDLADAIDLAGADSKKAPASVLIASVPGSRTAGTMRVSTGERVSLDRGAIVGRRPRLTRVQGLTAPALVTVPSPNQDISRNHVEIRVEGRSLLAVDLGTTNGTLLRRGQAEPVRLHPGEETLLVSGDVLDLGEEVTLEFSGLE